MDDTPQIRDLIPDIYSLLKRQDTPIRVDVEFKPPEVRGTLRLSGMGPKCPRALWYSVHHPELAEPLPPWVIIKYNYGHVLEAYALQLAKSAGHRVEGEQDELVVDGIRGHRDAVIDGCVVDVKSCSSIQFAKYKDGSISKADSFGYLDQLDGYLVGSRDDDLVTDKQHGYILAIDKTLGHCCLYEHRVRPEHIRSRIKSYKEIVGLPEPPGCTCGTETDGESGNIKLDVKASYSSFKFVCFPKLRTVLYAKGPVFFTKIVKYPKNKGIPLPELDQNGKIIYN